MKRYVVGFLFSPDKSKVVLIKKERPEWQKGLLNGVGGHVEDNETSIQAMIREFDEETGVRINNWELFHSSTTNEGQILVRFFRATSYRTKDVETTTDERVICTDVSDLNLYRTVYNLSWLIPLALDEQTNMSNSDFNLKPNVAP